jgi:hypothetical protein
MVHKVLWMHSLSEYIQNSHIVINNHDCRVMRVVSDDRILQKILTSESTRSSSKGSNSFETHIWAGHSELWGMPWLTDDKRRIDPTFTKMLAARLQRYNRGLMRSASNGWGCFALEKKNPWQMAIPGKLSCNWSQLRKLGYCKNPCDIHTNLSPCNNCAQGLVQPYPRWQHQK